MIYCIKQAVFTFQFKPDKFVSFSNPFTVHKVKISVMQPERLARKPLEIASAVTNSEIVQYTFEYQQKNEAWKVSGGLH